MRNFPRSFLKTHNNAFYCNRMIYKEGSVFSIDFFFFHYQLESQLTVETDSGKSTKRTGNLHPDTNTNRLSETILFQSPAASGTTNYTSTSSKIHNNLYQCTLHHCCQSLQLLSQHTLTYRLNRSPVLFTKHSLIQACIVCGNKKMQYLSVYG